MTSEKKPRRLKRTPKQIQTKTRHLEALKLRAEGLSLSEIAGKLGYAGVSGVAGAIDAALKLEASEGAERLRGLQSIRLRKLWRRAWEAKDFAGCIRILTREAKLHGLDAPEQIHVQAVIETEEDVKAIIGKEIQDNKEFREFVRAELAKADGAKDVGQV